jgi:hypothetical protein
LAGLFFFSSGPGFKLRALHLLGRHPTAWAMILALFALVLLQVASCVFAWMWFSYFCCLHSWDNRGVPPYLAYCMRWGLANFFTWAGLQPQSSHSLSPE